MYRMLTPIHIKNCTVQPKNIRRESSTRRRKTSNTTTPRLWLILPHTILSHTKYAARVPTAIARINMDTPSRTLAQNSPGEERGGNAYVVLQHLEHRHLELVDPPKWAPPHLAEVAVPPTTQ